MTKLEEIKYKAEQIAQIRYNVYAGKCSLMTAPYEMGILAEQIMGLCENPVIEQDTVLYEEQ